MQFLNFFKNKKLKSIFFCWAEPLYKVPQLPYDCLMGCGNVEAKKDKGTFKFFEFIFFKYFPPL